MKIDAKRITSLPFLLSFVLILIPIVASSFLVVFFVGNEAYFASLSTFYWVTFALLLAITQTLALTPPTFCGLVLGYFWGMKTLPLLFVINLLSILAIYILVKKFRLERYFAFFRDDPKTANILTKIKESELQIITLTKLSPVLPFTLTNILFTISGARLKNILLGGFLGMIPRTIIAVWSGTQALALKKLLENPNEGSFQKILLILLVLVSSFGLLAIINRALKKVVG